MVTQVKSIEELFLKIFKMTVLFAIGAALLATSSLTRSRPVNISSVNASLGDPSLQTHDLRMKICSRWPVALASCLVFFLVFFSDLAAAHDHSDTAATASNVSVGSNTTGVIELGGDEDLFKLTVPTSG